MKSIDNLTNLIKHVESDEEVKDIFKEEFSNFNEATSNVNLPHREKEISANKETLLFALVSRT